MGERGDSRPRRLVGRMTRLERAIAALGALTLVGGGLAAVFIPRPDQLARLSATDAVAGSTDALAAVPVVRWMTVVSASYTGVAGYVGLSTRELRLVTTTVSERDGRSLDEDVHTMATAAGLPQAIEPQFELRYVGPSVYLTLPKGLPRSVAGGKAWNALPRGELASAVTQAALLNGSLTPTATVGTDPATLLGDLQHLESLRPLGERTVDGVRTARFEGTLSVPLGTTVTTNFPGRIHVMGMAVTEDFFVDADGFVRRLEARSTLAIGSGKLTDLATTDFTPVGGAFSVSAPPAAEVNRPKH